MNGNLTGRPARIKERNGDWGVAIKAECPDNANPRDWMDSLAGREVAVTTREGKEFSKRIIGVVSFYHSLGTRQFDLYCSTENDRQNGGSNGRANDRNYW